MKKIPLRTCVVTREQLPKMQLLRIVKDNEGHITVDLTGRANGRGAYLKKSSEALAVARKSNALARAREVSTLSEEIYTRIEEVIKRS